MKGWFKGLSTGKQYGVVAGAIVLVVVIVSVADGGGSSGKNNAAKTTATLQRAADELSPAPKHKTANQRLRDALDNAKPVGAGEVDVQHIDYGRPLTITLKTPSGGFQGTSTGDLNHSAAAAFKAVYGDADYPAKTETVVVFKGGLVSKATGKDLPNVNTGIYTLKSSQARQIDWSDDDAVNFNIDWSLYRDFVHPAIKEDD